MRRLKWAFLAVVVLLVASQAVQPRLTNPPADPQHTIQNVPPEVDAILRRSCYDCHSNETRWPWYARVSPVSWLLKHDVDEARQELSFSEFATYSPKKAAKKLQESCKEVKEGEMPLWQYLPLHPEARLTETDKQTLCSWATAAGQQLAAAR